MDQNIMRHIYLLPILLIVAACGNDPATEGPTTLCPAGEVENPITGACQAEMNNTANNTVMNNTANNTANNMTNNPPNNTPNNTANNTPMGPAGPIDPMCVDGRYMETVASDLTDLSAELAAYDPNDLRGFITAVAAKRSPTAVKIVDGGLMNQQFNCIEAFVRDRSSGQAVVRQLSTVVHECGHAFDLNMGGFEGAAYYLTEDTVFTCGDGDTTERFGKTFARSRILGDEYESKRPKCNNQQTPGCDFYADVYLDGNPDDAMFDSGDQGFNSVLEETTQYVNSLATAYAIRDYYQGSASERDGILTFLWYVTRYLKMARTQYPDAYTLLSQDPCWRQGILKVWGRAWLYLSVTENEAALGIDDDTIEALVLDADLLDEIERLRTIEGCQ